MGEIRKIKFAFYSWEINYKYTEIFICETSPNNEHTFVFENTSDLMQKENNVMILLFYLEQRNIQI